MKIVKTQDAVGLELCHDIVKIVPGVFKGTAFFRGHIVREEDIPELLSIGKENLYVWEPSDDASVHEDDAAAFLVELACGGIEHMAKTEPEQGKIEVRAKTAGVFRSDTELLFRLNAIPEVAIAARHDFMPVREGDLLFVARVIPLTVPKEVLEMASAAAAGSGGPVFRIQPYTRKKVGIVTTGSEVYNGLVQDGMAPVLRRILAPFDHDEMGQVIVPDDPGQTAQAILDFAEKGADLILVTGGMSVDPDDRTPLAVKTTGADIVVHGLPILPGSMYLLATLGAATIIGVPGGVLYSKRSAFDLILPRVMADIPMTYDDFVKLSNGGLCYSCETCIFPNCGFGAL
ncbi:MAG: molybdopterin-binding protein [Clostridiales bacterium]|nr:molybdopterin-binding protein [Clostridiales bacterium]